MHRNAPGYYDKRQGGLEGLNTSTHSYFGFNSSSFRIPFLKSLCDAEVVNMNLNYVCIPKNPFKNACRYICVWIFFNCWHVFWTCAWSSSFNFRAAFYIWVNFDVLTQMCKITNNNNSVYGNNEYKYCLFLICQSLTA